MKFKKVEISAFRIYNNPENAIFDFASSSGEIANFISLYAPNGFGKTSFYDAVEWGVTGSVNRFFIRNKEFKKLETNQLTQNDIPLLRNAKLERDTYVKVFSNSNKKFFEKTISKDSKIPDLQLKKDLKSHEFHKVILSQEWISAFLTEKNGEQRYNKFMENLELSPTNDYYINLKHLLSFQETEEKRLKNEIEILENQVKDISEQNLLETINLKIERINKISNEELIRVISIDTTKKELIDIRNLITIRISGYEKKIRFKTNEMDNIRLATTGGNGLPSLKCFSDIKSLMPNILTEIKTIEELLRKFEEKRKTTNELASFQELLNDLSSKKEVVEAILLKYDQFENTDKAIKLKSDLIVELQDSIPLLNQKIDKFKRDEISLNEKLKTTIQQIAASEEKKKTLPSLEKDIDTNKNVLNKIKENIASEKSKIEPVKKNIDELYELLSEFKTLTNQVQEAKYSKKNLDDKPELIKLIDELNEIHFNLTTEKGKLQLINEKIEKQQNLNSTIQSFIEQGLVIVNERQSSKCPLCEQPYSDFATLANQISKNNALSDALKDLLSQKQTLNELISSNEGIINKGKLKLSDYYTSKISLLDAKVAGNLKSIDSVNVIIKGMSENQEALKSKNAELSTLMLGMTIDAYKKYLDDLIENEQETKEQIINELSACKEELKGNSEVIKIKNDEIILLEQDKEKLVENDYYLAVVEYFNTNHPVEEINKNVMRKSSDEYINSIKLVNDKIKKSNELLTSLKVEVSKFNEDKLKVQKNELEKKKKISEDELNKYILFSEENFDFDINTLDFNEISKYFENVSKDIKQILKDTEFIHSELVTLDKNSEHISEFLQTERTKIEIQTKVAELSFLKLCARPCLEEERKKVKEFLENRIKYFFYEKLINKLYCKIDPHPNFKEVEFRPDLDAEKPRLDIYVKNSASELIIPNLYFSTAQINILSLCIFLASALKSTEYDCIFIDDPIQSMDSINVLATIDLLRSIIVNNDKQIIISTHDENFHNLLKKKMPTELFKSKFLKLESFGKVVNDI